MVAADESNLFGLEVDYGSVQSTVALYDASLHSNNTAKLNSSPLSAADLAVLNAHQSDIAQLMQQ